MSMTFAVLDSVTRTGHSLRVHLAEGSFRVLLLIPIIWILNLTDLAFTILAGRQGEFIELNPLASSMGPVAQIVFKLTVLCFFTMVAVHMRRRRGAEFGCYLLLAVYGTLAVIWFSSFSFVLSPWYLRQFASF